MCTPTAMFVTTLLSTAMSMKAAKDQGDFEEGVAKYNARVAENTAQDVINKGVEEENIQRQKTAELLARQRAELGAAGVDIASGSALQLQQDTQTLGEADALRIRSGAEGQAQSLLTQAELTESQGEYAQVAASNKATGSLLKGASSVASTGVADKWFTDKSSALTGPGAGR